MKDTVFKLSEDPKDLEVAVEWLSNKQAQVKKQREIRDRAKRRLKPILEEAAREKQNRLSQTTVQ